MSQATIIGVDLAKNVFQLHGAAADGSDAPASRALLGRYNLFPSGEG